MTTLGSHRRIEKLPLLLANQIAAGEVVERPASVLKEVLENSLDAGAAHLDVEVESGGVRLIRVRDDGCGIEADDLALAFARHATSKIRSLADLEALGSLGFRGEALPSIASVARVEIVSRSTGADGAWRLAAGETRPEPAAHPGGTTITVRELFFNTPARRKFLRTEKTELRYVEDVVRRVALGHFEVELKFQHNGRPVWRLRAARTEADRLGRVAKLCGGRFCEHALSLTFEAADMRLWGWAGLPSLERHQSDLQYFFLNGRMIRDKLVAHAIRQAYGERLQRGCHPAFVLYLHMSPAEVDVNVHPTKHEVKFRESRLVHDFLFGSLHRALQQAADPELAIDAPAPGAPAPSLSRSSAPGIAQQMAAYGELARSAADTAGAPASTPDDATAALGRALGCVLDKYLVSQNAAGLVLVDIDAAREQVLHDRLQRALAEERVITRPLLVPATLAVAEHVSRDAEQRLARLLPLGIDMRLAAPGVVSLHGIPAVIEQIDAPALLGDLCTWLARADTAEHTGRAALLRLLVHRALGDAPRPAHIPDMDRLLRDLEMCDRQACAVRPAWRQLSADDLDRLVHECAQGRAALSGGGET